MKKLEKVIKIPIVLFVLGVLFLSIVMWKDIEIGGKFINMFMIIFFISICLVLGIGLILSIKSILKYIKNNPLGFLKSFIIRFIILISIDFGIDYIKGKEIDLVYGVVYSILLTIGSFYMEDRYL
ncbi:hypothetical protein [Tissierella creatinophila]|uniref:Uncharacterized protein n=1 Tax=Tissierella creatinophila DSM 6911 TaxID=1123403 RepID=A0A1U7M976_TISCR|nr:hypothetical protein [Tissierella creatinophila]OLS03831.1 hypothetical protein TICRE_01550 [Tissierella creatinophila DSM 6911]